MIKRKTVLKTQKEPSHILTGKEVAERRSLWLVAGEREVSRKNWTMPPGALLKTELEGGIHCVGSNHTPSVLHTVITSKTTITTTKNIRDYPEFTPSLAQAGCL